MPLQLSLHDIQTALKHQFVTVALAILAFCFKASSQDTAHAGKDIIDVLFGKRKAAKKDKPDSIAVGRLYFNLLPVPGYSPAMGFVIGAGISGSFLTGNKSNTHVSSGLANIMFTSKKQLNMNLRSNIYLPGDKWIAMGDWRLLFFSQPTYGLGVDFSEPSVFNWNGFSVKRAPNEQPMRFNYLRVYETVYRQVYRSWYAGLGLNIDRHYKIEDQSLDTIQPGITLTSHFLYSVDKQFTPGSYTVAGFSLNVLHDSRDNAINPQKGHYAQLTYRVNPDFLGSTLNSSQLFYELRTYVNTGKKAGLQKTLAFWIWGQQLLSGRQPYLSLPAIGWDMYNRSGRGYIQGRIRGENFWYGEAEYRYPLTRNGLLGAVAFVNASTASNASRQQQLFEKIAPGYGAGVRIKFSKLANTNICVDYGRGLKGSSGIYFNLQEAF